MSPTLRGRARARASLLVLAGLAVAAGCRAPVALAEVAPHDFQAVVDGLPNGGREVELLVEGSTVLRGVSVPPDEGGPIVLHLLESGGSVARGVGGRGRVLRQLADLGAGSLMLDWSGVGVSTGERDNANLRRDVSAMWREAVRLAGGEQDRVVVRATSLGTLAAADLLQRGARPGAVVLVAPVLAETAHHNFARDSFGRIFGGLATATMGPLLDVDLLAALGRTDVPLLVLLPADEDPFVTDEERDAIEMASSAPTPRVGLVPGGHIEAAQRTRSLSAQELAFLLPFLPALEDASARAELLQTRFPERASATALPEDEVTRRLARVAPYLRTQPAEHVFAAGLASARALNGVRLLWLLQEHDGSLPEAYKGIPPEALADALSLQDIAGELPLDLVAELRTPYQLIFELGGIVSLLGTEDLVRVAASAGGGFAGRQWSSTMSLAWLGQRGYAFEHEWLWRSLLERGLLPDDARRQMLRVLLFVYGHAHRLGADPDGVPRVEVWRGDAWEALDVDVVPGESGPGGAAGFAGTLLRQG